MQSCFSCYRYLDYHENNPSIAYASAIGDRVCFQIGTTDEEDYPFDQETYGGCGDDYHEGISEGCMPVNDNKMKDCEITTGA